jgi:hypothetical protein
VSKTIDGTTTEFVQERAGASVIDAGNRQLAFGERALAYEDEAEGLVDARIVVDREDQTPRAGH